MITEKFFGRQDYLDILEKRIRAFRDGYRQNIAIIGDEFVGKTSILIKFLNKFCDNRVIIIYLEARPESQESLVKRFVGVLLYNFLSNSGIGLREDLEFLIRKSQKYIPQTIDKIKILLNVNGRKKKSELFTQLLSLPQQIYRETGKSCVVIFDEFIHLEKIGINNLYKEWSKFLISQNNTMFIVTSSMKFKTKLILSKNLSLLFGNFELITVEPFDIKTSYEYLKFKLDNSEFNTAEIRDFLLSFTGGYPFYLEVITDALLKQGQNNLALALESLLFDSSGTLHQRFYTYINRFLDSNSGKDNLSIIYLIAGGRNKIKDIAHILHKSSEELNARVNQLLELDIITRTGDFLRINDRIFGFWLKFVYQEKLSSLTFNAQNQKEKFREKIDGLIQDFYSNTHRPVRERLLELMRLFEDELIQVERKKVRLNHFREIKPLEFNIKNLRDGLIGRSKDSLWIMAFKPGLLTEEDIVEFSRECKKYRHKLQRKIIVTLQDIDANTRLRAMEEKIWTWNIDNINQILDLYSKPWVVGAGVK